MEQKRKIIIPLGGSSSEAAPARNFDGGGGVPAPLFDEEATMGARPVVPLAEASNWHSRRFPMLALVVIVAVSAGVAGGFVIGLYKSRQTKQSATTSTAATTTMGTDATAQAPAQQLPATVASEKTSAPPVRATTAENAPVERAARDNRPKQDEAQVIPPVEVRERAREKRDREDRSRVDASARADDEREIKRQKKERRRRARDNDETDADLNQPIERGARELNRIREIFEGQHP